MMTAVNDPLKVSDVLLTDRVSYTPRCIGVIPVVDEYKPRVAFEPEYLHWIKDWTLYRVERRRRQPNCDLARSRSGEITTGSDIGSIRNTGYVCVVDDHVSGYASYDGVHEYTSLYEYNGVRQYWNVTEYKPRCYDGIHQYESLHKYNHVHEYPPYEQKTMVVRKLNQVAPVSEKKPKAKRDEVVEKKKEEKAKEKKRKAKAAVTTAVAVEKARWRKQEKEESRKQGEEEARPTQATQSKSERKRELIVSKKEKPVQAEAALSQSVAHNTRVTTEESGQGAALLTGMALGGVVASKSASRQQEPVVLPTSKPTREVTATKIDETTTVQPPPSRTTVTPVALLTEPVTCEEVVSSKSSPTSNTTATTSVLTATAVVATMPRTREATSTPKLSASKANEKVAAKSHLRQTSASNEAEPVKRQQSEAKSVQPKPAPAPAPALLAEKPTVEKTVKAKVTSSEHNVAATRGKDQMEVVPSGAALDSILRSLEKFRLN